MNREKINFIKKMKTFGRLTFHEYCENIDKVTAEQINHVIFSEILWSLKIFPRLLQKCCLLDQHLLLKVVVLTDFLLMTKSKICLDCKLVVVVERRKINSFLNCNKYFVHLLKLKCTFNQSIMSVKNSFHSSLKK